MEMFDENLKMIQYCVYNYINITDLSLFVPCLFFLEGREKENKITIQLCFILKKGVIWPSHKNLAQGYLERKIFKCVYLSLFFHNYKIIFKVRISSPLQTKLIDGSNRKETRPRRPRIQFENFPCETFPCNMSLCPKICCSLPPL